MNDYDRILSDLFGGNLFGEGHRPTQRFGFVQPKHERTLNFKDRLNSRIACNKFILEQLRVKS